VPTFQRFQILYHQQQKRGTTRQTENELSFGLAILSSHIGYVLKTPNAENSIHFLCANSFAYVQKASSEAEVQPLPVL
jgi:hypothetical protein